MVVSEKSRGDFSFETADGDYFDQVIAISQDIINRNFEVVHGANKALQSIHYDPPKSGIQFKAELLAPRVVLKANIATNANTVYYIIRIKKGTLKVAGVSDPLVIDDWELASEVPLGDITIHRNPETGKALEGDDQKAHQRQLDDFFKVFLVPGDYSVQRLYAALSSASWVRLEESLTYTGSEDGKKIPFSVWKRRHPEFATAINAALTDWGLKMESRGLNTIGVQFKLPENLSPEESKLLFVPYELSTQVYPYKTHDFGPKTGYDGLCGNNCLLYCETVNGRKMGDNLLFTWRGNLALPRDPNRIDGHKVDGTFALHYKLILETFILPQLQGLCQASELHMSLPHYKMGRQNEIIFVPVYSFGRQPTGTPTRELRAASDPYFKYSRSDEKDPTYTWQASHKRVNWDQPTEIYSRGNSWGLSSAQFVGWGRYKIFSTTNLSVSCVPGTPTIKVHGSTSFDPTFEFSMRKDKFYPESGAQVAYHLLLSWDIELEAGTTPEGILEIKLKKVTDDLLPQNLGFTESDSGNFVATGSARKDLRRFIEENIQPNLRLMIDNLKKIFQSCGRFIYPSYGSLVFSNPLWDKNGHLMVDISYAAVPEGQQIAVPDPRNHIIEEPPIPPPKTNEAPIQGKVDPPRLKWINRSSYDAATKRTTLQIVVSNPGEKTYYFQYLSVTLLLNEEYKALFDGTDFAYADPNKESTESDGADPDNTYYWVFNEDKVFIPELSVDYPEPDRALELIVWGKRNSEYEDRFYVMPGGSLTLTLKGAGEPGKYAVKIYESWKDGDDEPSDSSIGDAGQIFQIEV